MVVVSNVVSYVDVIEVGIILVFVEGMKVVLILCYNYLNYILVCDMKIIDGGVIFLCMVFEVGVDWIIVLVVVYIVIIVVCKKVVDELNGEI